MIEKIHKCAIQELKGNRDFVLVDKQDFIELMAKVNQIIEHLNNLENAINYSEPPKIEMQPDVIKALGNKFLLQVKSLDYGGRVLECGKYTPKKRKRKVQKSG